MYTVRDGKKIYIRLPPKPSSQFIPTQTTGTRRTPIHGLHAMYSFISVPKTRESSYFYVNTGTNQNTIGRDPRMAMLSVHFCVDHRGTRQKRG